MSKQHHKKHDARKRQRADIATRLRDARQASGMTQVQVDESAGHPRGTMAHYECGTRAPDVWHLHRIAGVLSTSVDDLMRPVSATVDK